MSLPIIKGDDFVTVMFTDGSSETITDTHPNYKKILKAIRKDKSEEKIKSLCDTIEALTAYLSDRIEIRQGVLMYGGEELNNVLATRILEMLEQGFNIAPMVNFLDNLQSNPSKRAVDELYTFLEVNQMPITDEGYFLAYKSVNDNYRDYHSNTFDNSIGQTVTMPRNKVDDNKERTCSTGLHFASRSYAESFGGSGHLMILAINPADVVSIPVDYNNTKGRCCRYEVIGEVEKVRGKVDEDYSTAVWSSHSDYCEECGEALDDPDADYCDECWDEQ